MSSDKVPAFLNEDFFKSVIKKTFMPKSEQVKVRNVTTSLIGGGGENYTSNIYSADLEYEESTSTEIWKEISLLVKHMKKFEYGFDIEAFEKEMSMYQETVPEIEKILRNEIQFSPRCYYIATEPSPMAVFQNLSKVQYKLADRTKSLDEDHARSVLRKIGKFHAASMCCAKENPDLLKYYKDGFLSEKKRDSKVLRGIFINSLNYLIRIIQEWPDYEVIARKLKILEENFFDKYLEMERRAKIKVINHGDLWVNNFMFKYENGKPIDVLFFDFQITFYGSLGIDVHYFLNTSVKLDVLKMKRYELLKEYYHSFRETLENLKYEPVPSWDDVMNEIRATELYGFISFEAIFPLISLDRESSKDNSIEIFENEEKTKKNVEKMYSFKHIREAMPYMLNRFDELGVFDFV